MSNSELAQFEFPTPDSSEAQEYRTRTVFWLGNGRQIAGHGYTVFMPVMFGKPFPKGSERLANEAAVCLNREFSLFTKNTFGPITDWLRALCREVHGRCGGRGIGAIGLCLSGGFVLSLMVDKSVLAPVASEPSLPLCVLRGLQKDSQAALGISPDELRQAKERSQGEKIPVIGLRFKNDWICPSPRFDTLQREFGDNFVKIELPSQPGNPYGIPGNAHSVLTEDYAKLEKFISACPDEDPRKQVIEFLNRQLKSV